MKKNSLLFMIFDSDCVIKNENQLFIVILVCNYVNKGCGVIMYARFAHKEMSPMTIWPACSGQCWVPMHGHLFVEKNGHLWMFTERIKELMGYEARSLCRWSQAWSVKTSQHSGFHQVTGIGALLTGATEWALNKHVCACITQKQRSSPLSASLPASRLGPEDLCIASGWYLHFILIS